MHRTLNRSLQDVLMSERIPRTDRNSSCQVLIVHSLLLVICRSRSTGITAERALSLEMERIIERQPFREITTPVNQKPDAQRTPSDDIVHRLMTRIRELEHRLFDPEGAWGRGNNGSLVHQVNFDHCRRCWLRRDDLDQLDPGQLCEQPLCARRSRHGLRRGARQCGSLWRQWNWSPFGFGRHLGLERNDLDECNPGELREQSFSAL